MSTDNKTDLALQALRFALRDIANYGDCYRTCDGGEDDDEAPCTCPVCVAKRALKTEEAIEWRFVGHMDYRRASMQWLATNCGMTVLEGAGFKYDWDRAKPAAKNPAKVKP